MLLHGFQIQSGHLGDLTDHRWVREIENDIAKVEVNKFDVGHEFVVWKNTKGHLKRRDGRFYSRVAVVEMPGGGKLL